MDFIFNSIADVGVMLVLIVFCFPEALSGYVFRMGRDIQDAWFSKQEKKVRGMAPWWVFPLVQSCLNILIITAFYVMYRSVGLTSLFGEAVDVLTLLFIFNIALQKLWAPVFFVLQAPWAALIILIFMEATAVAVLAFFWMNDYTISFGVYFVYPVWGLYLFYVNVAWLWIHGEKPRWPKRKCDSASTLDSIH